MTSGNAPSKQKTSKLSLYLIIAVCLMPTIAAFYAYYFIKWEPNTETTNYGRLIVEQPAVPQLQSAKQLDGKTFDNTVIVKKWVYLTIGSGQCDESCAKRLYTTRQLKAIAGRERERIERLWWVTDAAPISTDLLNAHPDLKIARIQASELAFMTRYLQDQTGTPPEVYIWMIDPLGKLFIQYPIEPDPNLMKRDLTKLLYASKAWQQ